MTRLAQPLVVTAVASLARSNHWHHAAGLATTASKYASLRELRSATQASQWVVLRETMGTSPSAVACPEIDASGEGG